ncbi:MAG TPA: S41 family peptidase [Anaerolineales bacterium]|nr:S41 family peptidase [Anaerolineales bacterium]
MAKILKVILFVLIGLALLLGGFTGGFVVGHMFPFNGFQQAFPSVLSGVPTVSPESQSSTPQDLQTLFKPFWDAWQIIHTNYVDQPVDDTKLMEGAITGMVQSLGDPHSEYMDPQVYKDATNELSGSYEGIGAYVDTTGTVLTITKPIPGSPAEKAGLMAGDQIIAVDGVDMTGVSPEQVRSKVIGPAGTTVHLTVHRPGQTAPLQFAVVRAQINIPSVSGKMLDNGIAYVQVTDFGETTGSELQKTLTTLLAQNPRGLILDLRDNPGGYLNTAVQVVSQFVDHGPVVYEQTGDGKKKEYDAMSGGLATKIPMVVLINSNSASASEITAGALQDDGRAKLVGVVSYGKGSVQIRVPLSNNEGAVAITIAHWLTPNGTLIDKKGLTPDVYVPMTAADVNAGLDPQLDAASQTLLDMINGTPIPTSMPTATPTSVP